VPAAEIDPLQMDAAYYLSANGVPAAKPYTLLREALKRSKKVAVAKFALRGRERLGMLRVVGDVIAMHGLLWPDEIRRPEGVAPETEVTIRDAELDLADALMDTLGQVELDSLHDDYRAAVEEMIAAKSEGVEPERERAPAAGGGKVIDLMAALESSVKAAKEARGDASAEPGGGDTEEAPASGSAQVRELKPRGRAAKTSAEAAPKETGGKKSTSTAKKPAAKTAAKSTAKSTARTASKSTSKTEAKGAGAGGTAKSTARTAKKAAAKKATPRKRASA
jgi:DNA end-binding protein Ku